MGSSTRSGTAVTAMDSTSRARDSIETFNVTVSPLRTSTLSYSVGRYPIRATCTRCQPLRTSRTRKKPAGIGGRSLATAIHRDDGAADPLPRGGVAHLARDRAAGLRRDGRAAHQGGRDRARYGSSKRHRSLDVEKIVSGGTTTIG